MHPSLSAWTGLVPLIRGADGVLELPVGTIDATGTAVGDRGTTVGPGGFLCAEALRRGFRRHGPRGDAPARLGHIPTQ